jgi:hypothetical protein
MKYQKKAGWFFLLGLLMTLAICTAITGGASETDLPHFFYGNVTISGLPAPPGTHITAEVTGGGEDYITTIEGRYGGGFLVETFMVQAVGDSMIEEGAPISFFINNIPAEIYEVGKGPWMNSYPFNAGSETNLDLKVGTVGPQYTISASAGTGGTISPSGSVQVSAGTSRTFTISPDSCHNIQNVIVDGASVGAVPTYTFNNVATSHTIQATFAPKTLYVTSSTGPGGSISPLGQQAVPCNGAITFTITPSTGYLIQDVVVNSVAKGPVSSYTIDPVTMNQTIVASFMTVPAVNFTILASAGPNGSITPAGSVTVMYGADQAFTMIADTGYTINQVVVDGSLVTRTPVYTFNDVVADHTIEVSFMEGAPEYFVVGLGDGWNLFSTPIKLATGHQNLETIFPPESLENIEVILGWNGSSWYVPGYGYELKPLSAVYIKVQDSATAFLYPYQDISIPPSRSLPEGWNLIGPAPDYQAGGFSPNPVEDSLITIYGDATEPGYLIVKSPGINQPGWSYVRDGPTTDLLPYKGYWVYMENQKTLAGFSTTPIS